MCGGYSIAKSVKILKARFKARTIDDSNLPNFNARPGQNLPVILNEQPDTIQNVFWGYLPHWIKDPSAKKIINARAETVAIKPFYKDSFLRRRCLIISDGFYEWKPEKGGKQPYRIHFKTDEPFAFAGVWDTFKDKTGKNKAGFSIITTEANTIAKKVHDRMPVILEQSQEAAWLNPETPISKLQKFLHPLKDGILEAYPVSKKVNVPVTNSPSLIEPIN